MSSCLPPSLSCRLTVMVQNEPKENPEHITGEGSSKVSMKEMHYTSYLVSPFVMCRLCTSSLLVQITNDYRVRFCEKSDFYSNIFCQLNFSPLFKLILKALIVKHWNGGTQIIYCKCDAQCSYSTLLWLRVRRPPTFHTAAGSNVIQGHAGLCCYLF